jgi:hypothetical protein
MLPGLLRTSASAGNSLQTSNLSQHNLASTNTSGNAYSCIFCPYRTCSTSRFISHMRRHRVERNNSSGNDYTCLFCGYGTSSVPHLYRHIRRHKVERNNSCKLRIRSAALFEQYMRFMVEHNFPCDCSYCCMSRNLNTPLNIEHRSQIKRKLMSRPLLDWEEV